MDNQHFTIRLQRRGLRLALALAVIVAIMAPVAVIAAGGAFTDDDTSIFETDIEWLAASGVTAGCNPPTNDNFCPDDNVTRGQMAAFMRRFAQYLGAEDAVVSEADHAAAADSATDATQLGGAGPNQYRTITNGIACDGSSCPDAAAVTNTEILELSISAPTAGVLQLNASWDANIGSPTNDYTAGWLTLDGDTGSFNGCEGSFLGVPLGSHVVDATSRLAWLDGNIFHSNYSMSPVVAVAAGTHTVRLCGFANVLADSWSASLSATWTAEGSATVLSSSPLSAEDLSPDLVARLEAATSS